MSPTRWNTGSARRIPRWRATPNGTTPKSRSRMSPAFAPMQSTARRGARAPLVLQVPGQRQRISAASAVSAKGALWFATYADALTGALFADLLRRMLRGRRKPLQLILDGLPPTSPSRSRNTSQGSTASGSYMTCPAMPQTSLPMHGAGAMPRVSAPPARLQKGERLANRITAPFTEMARRPALIRSFSRHPSVLSISAC